MIAPKQNPPHRRKPFHHAQMWNQDAHSLYSSNNQEAGRWKRGHLCPKRCQKSYWNLPKKNPRSLEKTFPEDGLIIDRSFVSKRNGWLSNAYIKKGLSDVLFFSISLLCNSKMFTKKLFLDWKSLCDSTLPAFRREKKDAFLRSVRLCLTDLTRGCRRTTWFASASGWFRLIFQPNFLKFTAGRLSGPPLRYLCLCVC